MTQEVKIERGEIYTGKVVSVMPFGAFVELVPGKDGLVHISELSEDPSIRVNRVEDVVNVGDEVTVMVTDVAPNGKVSLSRRAALTGELPEPKQDRGPRPPRGPRPDGPAGRVRAAAGSAATTGGDRGGFASRPGDSRRRPGYNE